MFFATDNLSTNTHLVAKVCPAASLIWTMSKEPGCLSLLVITPTRPKLRPPVSIQRFPVWKIQPYKNWNSNFAYIFIVNCVTEDIFNIILCIIYLGFLTFWPLVRTTILLKINQIQYCINYFRYKYKQCKENCKPESNLMESIILPVAISRSMVSLTLIMGSG